MMVTCAFLALLIEALFGYPKRLSGLIGHPVMWIGALIALLDEHWNQAHHTPRQRRIRGLFALLTILSVTIGAGLALQGLIGVAMPELPWLALLVTALIASSLMAQRSLYDHVAAVALALETDGISAGRIAVASIVGRDPADLDEAGVARAAIESLAENFSDGIIAPAMWVAVGGLPFGMAYKGVNTADSMIGHKSARHRDFGRAAARFDDLINFVPARFSALLIVTAATLMPAASPQGAWRALARDASFHRSPNAGWPEAAMAGALGLALAGPRTYDGNLVEDAVMGRDGRRNATAADIRTALKLYVFADALFIALLGVIAILLTTIF